MPRILGPFEVVSVHDSTPTILQDGIETTISIDHATHALSLQESPTTDSEKATSTKAPPSTEPRDLDPIPADQYVTQKNVRHIVDNRERNYLVQWVRILSRSQHHLTRSPPAPTFYSAVLKTEKKLTSPN